MYLQTAYPTETAQSGFCGRLFIFGWRRDVKPVFELNHGRVPARLCARAVMLAARRRRNQPCCQWIFGPLLNTLVPLAL